MLASSPTPAYPGEVPESQQWEEKDYANLESVVIY